MAERIVSFNVNGVRARGHQLEAVVERHAPLVLGLQEIKAADDDFPHDAVRALGYRAVVHGQKGHFGVALLSREAPEAVRLGLPGEPEDAPRRFAAARYVLPGGALTVVNGYFPQGGQRTDREKFGEKKRFYAGVREYLERRCAPDEALVVMGDFNVAPQGPDIGIGEQNARRWLREGKCGFLPEEQDWFDGLAEWGLVDLFRACHPEVDDRFSWFDYRSRGFERDPRRGLRIDHLLASRPLAERCRGAGIDYEVRAMQRPSDHCPVWAELAI